MLRNRTRSFCASTESRCPFARMQTSADGQRTSGKGNCSNNSAVESLFKALKAELVRHQNWQTRPEIEIALFEYINGVCNLRRRHAPLGRTAGRPN